MEDETVLNIGEKAPDFFLRDLQGHPHTLSHYHGQTIVINFWSSECPWSKRADEEVAELMKVWGSRVTWLFIAPNANEALSELKEVAKRRNLPRVLHDPERQITELFGAETTPHIFVLDPDGILRYQGAYDDVTFRQRTPTRNYLKDAVEAVLAGEAPTPDTVHPYGCTIVYYPEG